MKVLYASSEAAPFVKTGGLGDVAGSLPVALKEKGVDARVILPLYRCIKQEYKEKMSYINHIYIDMGWRKQYCGVFELQHEGCTFYFVDNEFYFNGDEPYGYIHLDCEKFIFFAKAVLSLLPTLDFRPDVINCNDWQTAAIPVFLDTFQDNPFYHGIKTVMTIHNLKFQGRWDLKKIKDFMGISDYYFTEDKLEYYKDGNLLKGGLAYATKISTVSESYAQEIKTQEYGEGLNGLISARSNDLWGIVNGISYTEWNPKTDSMIFEKFDAKNVLTKKKKNKLELQKMLNLPQDENVFMIGLVSRLTEQKGLSLIAEVLEQLLEENIQLVILGTGDEGYENMFRHYAWKYPEKVSANIYFSNDLSHKIYASCDAFLMPSRFEPCGLSQLISMRYGTVPIVRETGGLKDTVAPYNEFTGEGVGFSFANFNSNDMLHVIRYAKDVYYGKKEAWNGLIKSAMKTDYSWQISADKYINLYSEITGITVEQPKKEKTSKREKTETVAKKATPPETAEAEKKPAKKTAVKKTAKETLKVENKAEPKKEEIKKAEPAPKTEKKAEEKKAVKVEKKTEIKKEEPKKVTPAPKQEKKTEDKKTTEVKKAVEEKKAADVKKTAEKKVDEKKTADIKAEPKKTAEVKKPAVKSTKKKA